MDLPSDLTPEECVRLRAHWSMLSDYEQSYFRANAEAFLEWLRRQARDIFDKIASTVQADPARLDESLMQLFE